MFLFFYSPNNTNSALQADLGINCHLGEMQKGVDSPILGKEEIIMVWFLGPSL